MLPLNNAYVTNILQNLTVSIEEKAKIGTFILTTSFLGMFINFYILTGFLLSLRSRGGFFIYCTSKTSANIFAHAVALFWLTPALFSHKNDEFEPTNKMNAFLSQFLLFGVYGANISTQMFMSFNRFFSTTIYKKGKRKGLTYVAVSFYISWVVAIYGTFIGFSDCTFSLSINTLSFIPLYPCYLPTSKFQFNFPNIIIIITILLNTVNLIFIICGSAKRKIGDEAVKDSNRRKRRNIKLFAQVNISKLCFKVGKNEEHKK